MTQTSTTRILLLSNEFDSAFAIREALSHSGLAPALVQVASRHEFVAQLATDGGPTLVLLGHLSTGTFPLAEIVETVRVHAAGVPLVVLTYGADQSDDLVEAMNAIRAGASDYLHRSQFDRLPVILERARRDQGTAIDRFHAEVKQAADLMRESQKLVTIGRLAGSIAHEINNPLESVTNLLYLLDGDQSLSDRARDYLSLAQRELDRVAQIAKQTLNFYRDTPRPVRILPAELLDEVLVLYARRIAEKQLRIVREYDTGRSITASPGEIRQVFSNLITNAIEASTKGGTLHLRVRDGRKWRGQATRGLRISIADTGCGIGKSVRQRLGEPFFTTKGQQGTGLGLWVTQSIVERYGGTMQVSSSLDEVRHGTVFCIFLPASQRLQPVVAIDEAHGNSGSTAQTAGGGSGRRNFGSDSNLRNTQWSKSREDRTG